jgi:hypothetical protein
MGLGTEKKHLLTVHLQRMRILAALHIFFIEGNVGKN